MDLSVSLDSLLQGALASTFAVVGAVVSAHLLIRHDRQVRREDRQREIEQSAVRERLEAAAELATAAEVYIGELITPKLFVGSAQVTLISAGARFSATVATTNPNASAWAMELVNETLRARRRYTRWMILPGSKGRRRAALACPSHFIGWLRTWIADGGIGDDPPRSADAPAPRRD